ncbi:MAG: tyrosine recombinase XerC [Clostridiales bacterium]|nr:tyrosine recombinase XerC [Clostridiales bacterium]
MAQRTHISNDEMPNFLIDYLNYLETIKGKSKNTILAYSYDLRLFLRFIKVHKQLVDKDNFEDISIKDFSTETLEDITLSDLYSFLSFVNRERTNSSYARARKVASLKSFFNYLTNKVKIVSLNPTRELESPKILKKLPRYLNVAESKNLLNCVASQKSAHKFRDFAMLTLFLNCGMRLSELVGINLDDIRNNTISVTGKGGKERIIYLNHACVDALNNYLTQRPIDGVIDKNALFLSSRKTRISKNTVQFIVKKYIRMSGLDAKKYSTHKLRHTAATLMYKHGKVDVRALQKILGHETLATTQIYTHLDNQQLQDALDNNPLADFKPKDSSNTTD